MLMIKLFLIVFILHEVTLAPVVQWQMIDSEVRKTFPEFTSEQRRFAIQLAEEEWNKAGLNTLNPPKQGPSGEQRARTTTYYYKVAFAINILRNRKTMILNDGISPRDHKDWNDIDAQVVENFPEFNPEQRQFAIQLAEEEWNKAGLNTLNPPKQGPSGEQRTRTTTYYYKVAFAVGVMRDRKTFILNNGISPRVYFDWNDIDVLLAEQFKDLTHNERELGKFLGEAKWDSAKDHSTHKPIGRTQGEQRYLNGYLYKATFVLHYVRGHIPFIKNGGKPITKKDYSAIDADLKLDYPELSQSEIENLKKQCEAEWNDPNTRIGPSSATGLEMKYWRQDTKSWSKLQFVKRCVRRSIDYDLV